MFSPDFLKAKQAKNNFKKGFARKGNTALITFSYLWPECDWIYKIVTENQRMLIPAAEPGSGGVMASSERNLALLSAEKSAVWKRR